MYSSGILAKACSMKAWSAALATTQAVCRTPSLAVKSTAGVLATTGGKKRVQFRRRPIGEKHWAGLGIQSFNVAHLGRLSLSYSGQFVLLDDAGQVFHAVSRRHQAPDLGVAAHDLPVQIEIRLIIHLQRPLPDQVLQILAALGIYFPGHEHPCPPGDQSPAC